MEIQVLANDMEIQVLANDMEIQVLANDMEIQVLAKDGGIIYHHCLSCLLIKKNSNQIRCRCLRIMMLKYIRYVNIPCDFHRDLNIW
jgi:hypothetical protein